VKIGDWSAVRRGEKIFLGVCAQWRWILPLEESNDIVMQAQELFPVHPARNTARVPVVLPSMAEPLFCPPDAMFQES